MSFLRKYPPIEPYAQGMLTVTDGQHLYWEAGGNPAGKPAVVLHGGPGSGSPLATDARSSHPLTASSSSTSGGADVARPPVSDPATDLSTNTTEHLIADIEHQAGPETSYLRPLERPIDSSTPVGIACG